MTPPPPTDNPMPEEPVREALQQLFASAAKPGVCDCCRLITNVIMTGGPPPKPYEVSRCYRCLVAWWEESEGTPGAAIFPLFGITP
jgi:hypothetical protein